MKTKVTFDFNEDNRETICTIRYGNHVCIGRACCHPDDTDMMNSLTGQDIAYKRACIKLAKSEIKEMKIELKALQSFYNRVIQSKKIEDRCYVLYQLEKELNALITDIKLFETQKAALENGLKAKLVAKEVFYQQLRKMRGKKK